MENEQKMYTRREVDLVIMNLSSKFDLWDTKLDNIHDQVKTINGRVTKNAEDISSLKTWRDRTLGGLVVVVILVVPVLIYIVESWID